MRRLVHGCNFIYLHIPPFYGGNDNAILDSVKTGKFEFDSMIHHAYLRSADLECKNLITKMLCPPGKRLSPQEVLIHPWMVKFSDKTPKADLPPIVTKQLKVFRGAQKVKKVVLTYLATQLSEKEMEPLKRIFMSLDKNGDGILSLEEINEGLKDRSDEKELREIMTSMDTDGSGFIDYNGNFPLAPLRIHCCWIRRRCLS